METRKNEFIPWAKPHYWQKEKEYVNHALDSSWISGGPYVEQLEREVSRFCGAPHALAVANGTAAIHLAYLALELEPGDEVIVPGFGFMAAANLALLSNLKPVFAEVDSQTWCLTAEAAERCITPRTKAIVPIHTYGNVCKMDEIMTLADTRKITVIEDAAESFGSKFKGQYSGTIGDLGTFSFHATKTITTGEGGMTLTRRESLATAMALYRSHGMQRKQFYLHDLPGHNFRLTNMQAALGCAQFEMLSSIVSERKRVHAQYLKHFANIPGIQVQYYSKDVDPVLWAIALSLDPKAFPQGRNVVMEQMRAKNIETRPGFVSPSEMSFYPSARIPICESLSRNVISLPTYPTLSNEQIEFICSSLERCQK